MLFQLPLKVSTTCNRKHIIYCKEDFKMIWTIMYTSIQYIQVIVFPTLNQSLKTLCPESFCTDTKTQIHFKQVPWNKKVTIPHASKVFRIHNLSMKNLQIVWIPDDLLYFSV